MSQCISSNVCCFNCDILTVLLHWIVTYLCNTKYDMLRCGWDGMWCEETGGCVASCKRWMHVCINKITGHIESLAPVFRRLHKEQCNMTWEWTESRKKKHDVKCNDGLLFFIASILISIFLVPFVRVCVCVFFGASWWHCFSFFLLIASIFLLNIYSFTHDDGRFHWMCISFNTLTIHSFAPISICCCLI